jgi:hypothetical protein
MESCDTDALYCALSKFETGLEWPSDTSTANDTNVTQHLNMHVESPSCKVSIRQLHVDSHDSGSCSGFPICRGYISCRQPFPMNGLRVCQTLPHQDISTISNNPTITGNLNYPSNLSTVPVYQRRLLVNVNLTGSRILAILTSGCPQLR